MFWYASTTIYLSDKEVIDGAEMALIRRKQQKFTRKFSLFSSNPPKRTTGRTNQTNIIILFIFKKILFSLLSIRQEFCKDMAIASNK
jgi:hypothetical protein